MSSETFPPAFSGEVNISDVSKDGKHRCYVQIYDEDGNVLFRKLYRDSKENISMASDTENWIILKSVLEFEVDRVVKITPEFKFETSYATGKDNQMFWYDGGVLRNKAFPGKVVALGEINSKNTKARHLILEDEDRHAANQRWMYNKNKRHFLNGIGGDFVIDITGEKKEVGANIFAYPSNSQSNQQFDMITQFSCDGVETKVTELKYETDNALRQEVNPFTICTLAVTNDSSVETEVRINKTEVSTTESSATFNWENPDVVKASTIFKTRIPFIRDGVIKFSISRVTTVGSDSKEDNITMQTKEYTAPVSVAPNTHLQFQLLVKEGVLHVPFTATLKKGNRVWEEKGTFKGVNYFGLGVLREEQKITK